MTWFVVFPQPASLGKPVDSALADDRACAMCLTGRVSRVSSTGFALALAALLSACSGKEAPEANPTVSVQVATVKRATVERKVTGDAVLYPFDQSAITPK